MKGDPVIAPYVVVRKVSIVCVKCGPVFTHEMLIRNIFEARGILDDCHHRGCGGALRLEKVGKKRDYTRSGQRPGSS